VCCGRGFAIDLNEHRFGGIDVHFPAACAHDARGIGPDSHARRSNAAQQAGCGLVREHDDIKQTVGRVSMRRGIDAAGVLPRVRDDGCASNIRCQRHTINRHRDRGEMGIEDLGEDVWQI